MQTKIVIQTTLGDLIAALTEEAYWVAQDKQAANELVADMLSDLLTTAKTVPESWH